jgi:DNA-binding CsgD family transcriptional regulator
MVDRLTPRERECLALAAAGETNDQIAGHLCLTAETVRTHLNKTYRRLALGGVGNPRVMAAVLWDRAATATTTEEA